MATGGDDGGGGDGECECGDDAGHDQISVTEGARMHETKGSVVFDPGATRYNKALE